MSAWLLSKREIDVLVYWMKREGITKTGANDLGALLWAENYKSIRARYGPYDRYDGKFVKRPTYLYDKPRTFTDFNPRDPNQAAKMCRFYNYQTCEHSTYETSRAKRLVEKLYNYLVMEYKADWEKEGLKWGM
jgi:hypothetical protein